MTLIYKADTFGTYVANVADDTAISIDIPNNSAVVIGAAGATDSYFQVSIRSTGSMVCQSMIIGAVANNAGTIALAGTTSTDGKLNFSTNNGKFYVENRLGATTSVKLTVLGG